jgi:phosphate transport system substrate-binding protein
MARKAAVTNPAYPITRPLYLTTKGAPAGDAKAFIDWAVSPAGQEIVKKNFVVAR